MAPCVTIFHQRSSPLPDHLSVHFQSCLAALSRLEAIDPPLEGTMV